MKVSFSKYPSLPEEITVENGLFTFTVKLLHDADLPHLYDHYTIEQLESFERFDWVFGILIIEAEYNGVALGICDTLGGLEVPETKHCGFSSAYISEVANRLIEDSQEYAEELRQAMIISLKQE